MGLMSDGRRFAVRLGLSFLLFAAIRPNAAQGSSELRKELSQLAHTLLVLVDKENEPSVSIGSFTPIGLPDSNSGPGIEQVLRQEMEAERKGIVKENAKLEIKGDYAFVPHRTNSALRVIKIGARLIDTGTGEEKKRLDFELTSNTNIAAILGFTGALRPQGSREERNKVIQVRTHNPSVHIHGVNKSLVSTTADSPFAVELLAKPLNAPSDQQLQPRSASEHKGKAFVEINKGELYEIKLYNHSGKEVAVSLSIDGLDLFAFSDDRKADGLPCFTHFIVGADQREQTFPGWHKTSDPKRQDSFLSFLVTDYGKGGASKFPAKTRGKLGVITVAICPSLPEDGIIRGGFETGFGPPVQVKQEVLKRSIGIPLELITVRYLRASD
jgi:hypothetical protein